MSEQETDGFERLADLVEDELVRRPGWITLTRVGWVAKGLVYATIAWATILIAADDRADTNGDGDAGYTGFVSVMAADPWTRAGLVLVAAGLVLYVAFRLVSVALIDGTDADAWAHRAGYLVSAMTYAAIAVIAAVAAAVGRPTGSDRGLVESASKALLETQPGRVVLAVSGVVTCGVALYFAAKGLRKSFLDELDLDGDHAFERWTVAVTGSVGWVGRAIVLAAVGAFVTWAAVTADPDQARGLDRSLQRLADSGAGRSLVALTGVLLAFYALFCVVSARHQDPTWRHEEGARPSTTRDSRSDPVSRRPTPSG